MKRETWHGWEIDFLIDNHTKLHPSEICKNLRWSESQTKSKMSRLGLCTKDMYDYEKKCDLALSLMRGLDPDFKTISKSIKMPISTLRRIYNKSILKKNVGLDNGLSHIDDKQYFKDEDEIAISVALKAHAKKYKYEDLSDSEKQIFDNI